MALRDQVRAAFGVERLAVWMVAVFAVVVVAATVATAGSGFVEPPSASFDAGYDADSKTVTITHAGGDSLDAAQVTVVVTNASGTSTANVTWGGPDGGRLTDGDTLSIDDPTVDADGDGNYFDADHTVGFPLTSGGTVEVRWTGRPLGAAEEQTVTLDTDEIGAN